MNSVRRLWNWLMRLTRTGSRWRPAAADAAALPVLSGQLREASRQIEDQVGAVCAGFQGVVSQARESVRQASALLDGKDSSNLTVIVEDCRRILSHLLERIETSSEKSLSAAEQLKRANQATRTVAVTLAEIDRIAFTSKLLALNAKIEAVHAGEVGLGFGLVADQVSQQADRSAELSSQIADVLKDLTTTMQHAVTGLGELAAADRRHAEASRTEVSETLTLLERTSSRMRGSLEATSEASRRLSEDIARLVMGLQFQDRVTQRIGHVVEALDSMHAGMADRSAAGASGAERRSVQSIANSYTMHDERQLHSQLTGSAEASGGELSENVELF